MSKISLFELSVRIVFSDILHSSCFFAERASLELHPSTSAFRLPPSTCQWKTLHM